MDKTLIRKHYRDLRNKILPQEAATAAESLAQLLLDQLSIYLSTPFIGAYHAIDGEISLAPVISYLANEGTESIFPNMSTEDIEFLNASGAKADASVFLVPLVAFDVQLNRVGFGKGYYDQLIAQKRKEGAIFIGCAYEIQLYPKLLPVHSHDQKLDFIVTEHRVFFPSIVL